MLTNRQISVLGRLIGNVNNVTILRYLMLRGETSVNHLAQITGLTSAAISQKLKKMKAPNVVKARRSAQTKFYSFAEGEAAAWIKKSLNAWFITKG